MTRANGGAKTLADTIETILNYGAGPMNIALDDIRQAMRRDLGVSLDDAATYIRTHLATALDILGERGWASVKTTQHWEDVGHTVPGSEPEIRRCVAGIGKASATVGLHFTAAETDDWLWVYARDHGARVWRGKRHAEVERLRNEVESGRLTALGFKVADNSSTHPVIGDRPYTAAVRQIKAKT